MPWKPQDAPKFTKKADTPAKMRQWVHVANGMLSRGSSDAAAIEGANSVLDKHPSLKRK